MSKSELSEFGQHVLEHLRRTPQRQLPSQYFYDAVGTKLFEAITELEEYGLTRADTRLIESRADDMVAAAGRPRLVAELGSGNGRKTRRLLDVLHHPTYFPIDLSATALATCESELGAAARVEPVCATYLAGLDHVVAERRSDECLLVLFLGSTIGNYDRMSACDLLRSIRMRMRTGDSLLLGTDLVKPIESLLLAYDDPAGVTAAFNLNLLARVNRELGGNFRLRDFRHAARWCEAESRIEMHAVSLAAEAVQIPSIGLSFTLSEGETIWTESSHKYSLDDVATLADQSGFAILRQWVDEDWPFAESLLGVGPERGQD